MSVEKMNYYKEQKSHRKENLAKEKRRKKSVRAIGYGIGALAVVALCAAIGLTGYNAYRANEAAKPDYSVNSLVLDDFAGVLNEEEPAETEAAAEEGEAAAEAGEAEEAEAAAGEAGEAEEAEAAESEAQ